MARLLLIAIVAFTVTGCSHYWTRPPATLDEFATDHRECLAANSVPAAKRPGYGVVDEQAFRRCLIARGWAREDKLIVPAGYYRGYEEREIEPVRLDALPEQPSPRSWTERQYQIQRR